MNSPRMSVAICALVVLAGCSSVVDGSGGSSDSRATSTSGATPDVPSTGGVAPPPGPVSGGSTVVGTSAASTGASGSGAPVSGTGAPAGGSGVPALGSELVAFVQAGTPVSGSDYDWTRERPNGPRVPSYGSERYLQTPSKNINCFLDDVATCEIKERSYPDPPTRDCQNIGFQANYIQVSGGTVYRGLCLGGLPYSPFGNVLPYGHTLRVGDYACRSDEEFMACANVVTARGFVLSRTVLRAG